MLEIQPITAANLPDAVRLCLSGDAPGGRPPAFTRDVEIDCSRCKLAALRDRQMAGGEAWVAYRSGALVGYLELHRIDDAIAPIRGGRGHVVQCLRVPEPAVRDEVETALIEHAYSAVGEQGGLAVMARDKDWSRHGFTSVEEARSEVDGDPRRLWWRPASGAPPKSWWLEEPVEPLALVQPERSFPRIEGKVRIDLFTSDRCPWDGYVAMLVRDVAGALHEDVVLFETDCSERQTVLRTGVVSACAINGHYQPWYRPYRLPDAHMIRRAIERAV